MKFEKKKTYLIYEKNAVNINIFDYNKICANIFTMIKLMIIKAGQHSFIGTITQIYKPFDLTHKTLVKTL